MRALWLLLVLGCQLPTDPPDLGEPIPPRPEWATWYAEVWRDCGSTVRPQPALPFGALEFRVVPGPFFWWNGIQAIGAWQGHRIYLVADLLDWPVLVRHELLHAQLGTAGHPPIFAVCDRAAAGLAGRWAW